jgi:hypothetical protein
MAGMRRKILQVSPELLFELLKGMDGKRTFKITGIPADAKVIKATLAYFDRDLIGLMLESEDFPMTAPGEPYPIFDHNEIKVEDVTCRSAWLADDALIEVQSPCV